MGLQFVCRCPGPPLWRGVAGRPLRRLQGQLPAFFGLLGLEVLHVSIGLGPSLRLSYR